MKNKKSQERLKSKIAKSLRKIFQNSGSKKLNYKQISSKLQLNKPHERMLVSAVLNEFKAKGIIEETEKGKFRLIPRENVTIQGNIEITRRGAGYVTSELFENDI